MKCACGMCRWYVIIMFMYHCYQDFQRNINDIVDRTYTVHTDFHQGDQLTFRSNAGKQCVAMSLCSMFIMKLNQLIFGTHPL